MWPVGRCTTLWLHNWHKSVWVDWQLATSDSQMKGPTDSTWTSVQAERFVEEHEIHSEVEMCRKLCVDGRTAEAVNALHLLVQRGCHVPNNIFYHLLKRCIAHKDLVLGRRVHALTVESGYEGDAFLATQLIGLYASHGLLKEAMRVFTEVPSPNVYNWATIIFAFARHGEAAQAIRLYGEMHESSIEPDNRIYSAVIKACAVAGDLIAGKEVHAHILASHGKPDIFVQSGLLDMYAKCGSLKDARSMFDSLADRNVVTWTTMIAAYTQQGMGQEALSLYSSMQQEGLSPPDSVTFVCLLQACAIVGEGALHEGKELHAQLQGRGLQDDIILGGSLVNMYAKCGSLQDAREIFDRVSDRNVVTWTAMIAGYVQHGMSEEALTLYSSMKQQGLSPSSVTFVCLLQACASLGLGAMHQGKQLHTQIEEQGLQDDVVLGRSLVNMYAKCGSLDNARRVFDTLRDRDVETWTTMIAGYAQGGLCQEALSLYRKMQHEGLSSPSSVTFLCLLQACANVGVGALHCGKQLHAQIEEQGLQDDVVLGGSLVNMYVKCGSLEDARSMFDSLSDRNVVTWTAMIAGYAQHGLGWEALSLYSHMQHEGLCVPSPVTFVCLLQACASAGVGALRQGKQLHAQIEEQGLHVDLVLGGSLINMYVQCGSLKDARSMFDRLPDRNIATWNAMIGGYAQQGMGKEALILYRSMQQENFSPDSGTFIYLLQACELQGDLCLGKQLHSEIDELGMQGVVVVRAALVHMYAKCGSMFDSQQVFDSLHERTVEAWGALIGGYASQGNSEVVFGLLDRMKVEGIQPNDITFLSVLTVCSHVGLVDKGRKYFEVMRTDYGISPAVEHYTCMMDLLGRAGHLDEALQMAKTMPFPPSGAIWHTLLGACQKWNNVEIGQEAFQYAVSLDAKDAASYVLMSNIYAKAQMWKESKEMQARRVSCGAWKKPGQCWWVEKDGVVHTVVVGDKMHPEIEAIYKQLVPE